MRKLWVLIFVFLLVGCSVLPETPVEPIEVEEPVEFVFEEPAEHVLPIADTPEEETTPVETPEEIPEFTGVIEGTEAFKQKVFTAIDFLKENYISGYTDICKYVQRIKLIKSDKYAFADTKKEISLSETYFGDNVTWIHIDGDLNPELVFPLALVHETKHIKDYETKAFYTTYLLEKWALEAERDFLRTVGVDEEAIEEAAGEHLLENPWWED